MHDPIGSDTEPPMEILPGVPAGEKLYVNPGFRELRLAQCGWTCPYEGCETIGGTPITIEGSTLAVAINKGREVDVTCPTCGGTYTVRRSVIHQGGIVSVQHNVGPNRLARRRG